MFMHCYIFSMHYYLSPSFPATHVTSEFGNQFHCRYFGHASFLVPLHLQVLLSRVIMYPLLLPIGLQSVSSPCQPSSWPLLIGRVRLSSGRPGPAMLEFVRTSGVLHFLAGIQYKPFLFNFTKPTTEFLKIKDGLFCLSALDFDALHQITFFASA